MAPLVIKQRCGLSTKWGSLAMKPVYHWAMWIVGLNPPWLGRPTHLDVTAYGPEGLKGMNVTSVYSENKGSICVLFQTPEHRTPIELKESTQEQRTGLTPPSLGQGHVSLKRQPPYFFWAGPELGPSEARSPDWPAGSLLQNRSDSYRKHFPMSSPTHTLPSNN